MKTFDNNGNDNISRNGDSQRTGSNTALFRTAQSQASIDVAGPPADAGTADGYQLSLEITDPIVCVELRARTGAELERYVNTALSIGVMCLQQTTTRVDMQSLQAVVDQAKELVALRGKEVLQHVEATLREHFDPTTGKVSARITALIQKDGELERILKAYIGANDSAMAQTLAEYLGEKSALFKRLSPDEKDGVLAHIKSLVQTMLTDQTQGLLKQFSLDNKESAMSRFITELSIKHGALHDGIDSKIDVMRREFSLDTPDSALSRLMSRVEQAQKKISDEFSTDNESSALNRLVTMLESTNTRIEQQLTLDNDNSALSLMLRKLEGTQQQILSSHVDLQSAFAALHARKQEQARSPKHGNTFEEDLGQLVAQEARRRSDVFEDTSKTTGVIPHCKKGDHVIELGPETPAPGARVVWEAKEDKSWDEKRALAELSDAIKNRQAQIGIFVFSQKTAPEGMEEFQRYGNSIVVVWDAENPATDITVRAAYSLARALAVREAQKSDKGQDVLRNIEHATRAVEKQIGSLEEIQKLAQTVKGHGDKIVDKSDRMRKELVLQIEKLDEQIDALGANDEE